MLAAYGLMGQTDPLEPMPVLSERLISYSRPAGDLIRWNDIEKAKMAIAGGMSINYHGLSGAMDVEPHGALKSGVALMSFWVVEDEKISPKFRALCLQQTGAGAVIHQD